MEIQFFKNGLNLNLAKFVAKISHRRRLVPWRHLFKMMGTTIHPKFSQFRRKVNFYEIGAGFFYSTI